MKRIAALSLALALTLGLTACGGGNAGTAETPAANSTTPAAETTAPQAEPVEVVVFAAASLEATLTEIADLYKEVAPEVTLTFNFDSSGTLRTQIKEGAVCDLFISCPTTTLPVSRPSPTWPRTSCPCCASATTTCRWAPTPWRFWTPWASTSPSWSQVIYPAAVMKSSSGEAAEAAAQAFLDYLHTDENAIAVLEGVGFTVL